MDSRHLRVSLLFLLGVLLSYTWGYVAAVTARSVYPYVPLVALTVAVLSMAVVGVGYGPPRRRSRVVLLVAVSLLLYQTWMAYQRAAGLIGIDTYGFALWAARVLETGNPTVVESQFYSNAPVFHTFIAQASAVAGVGVDASIAAVSYAIAAFFPVVAYLLTSRTTRSYDAAALAAVLAAVFAVHLERAFWPIAQSFGMVLFLLYAYLLFEWFQSRTGMHTVMFVLLTAMIFTHKLIVFAGLLVVLALSVARIHLEDGAAGPAPAPAPSRRWYASLGSPVAVHVTFVVVVLAGQWFYLTTWGLEATFETLSGTPFAPRGAPPGALENEVPAAASVPERGLLSLFAHRSHALVALAVAGIAWAYSFVREPGRLLSVLLVTMGFVVVVLVLGASAVLDTGIANPLRVYYIVSVPLIVVIAFFLRRVLSWNGRARKLLPLCVVLALLVFQVFSAAAVVDLPGQDRVFLEESEERAKSFTNQHARGTVYTDSYYAGHRVAFVNASGRAHRPRYRPYEACLFDRTRCDVGRDYAMIRTDVEVYRAWSDRWAADAYRLDWRPERELRRSHGKVYSSGSVRVLTGG